MENLINKNENLTAEERKEFPAQISIEGYLYTKKDVNKKTICYRCSNRSTCRLTIAIEFEKIKKISRIKKRKKLNTI